MLRADGRLSTRSDVYLLGGLLHYVLAGGPPRRPPKGAGQPELIRMASTLPRLDPMWPVDLRGLLAACLDADPARRPDVAEVRSALNDHLLLRGTRQLLAQAAEGLETLERANGLSVADAYDLYGGVRFAVDQATRRDPEDGEARAARPRLLVAMARFELDRDNPQAARTFLHQVDDPPGELRARIDAGIAGLEAREARLAELEQDRSVSAARIPRILLAVLLGVVWMGLPVLLDVAGWERTVGRLLFQNGVNLTTALALVTVIYPVMRHTRLNRGVAACLVLSPICQSLMVLAVHLLGLPALAASPLRALGDAFLLLTVGAVLDLRILPAGLVYGACALLAATFPAWATPILVSGTLSVVVTASVLWGIARSA